MKKNKKKNIISIITGGAGFLGKQIFESLLELNHKKIIIIDNNKKNIDSFEKNTVSTKVNLKSLN